MKKNNAALWVICAMLAFLVFIGASVWEGSAAVSLGGELPEGAYYAATNSFPRNTVVDVTNLENGRTIRVIVAAGLDSPGLLAMLSRNAATAIGLPLRGMGRIRMTAPSDPVAFSRFTEEREFSGVPETPETEAVVSSTVRTATAGDLSASTPEDRFYSTVVNRPEAYTPPATSYPQDGSVLVEPQPMWILEETPRPPEIGEAPYPEAPPPLREPSLVAVPGPEPAQPQPMLVAPAYPNTSLSASPYAWQTAPPYVAPPAGALPRDSVITLERAEERPPRGAVAPGWEIPPPPRAATGNAPGDAIGNAGGGNAGGNAGSNAGGDDTYLDPRYFIGPIPQLSRPPQPPARVVNPPPPVPARTVIAAAPVQQAGTMFSVPVINELEWGKRYVQIGAFTRPETLETAVAQANKIYPLAIQTGGSRDALVYRLLIGPLNAGESAAVLRRVKSRGFPDAFVR